jgi:hypothetical protein
MSENYTREALIKDLVRAISTAEGKAIYFGAATDKGVDRAYITEVTQHAIDIVSRLPIKSS